MSARDKTGLWSIVSIFTYSIPKQPGFYAFYKLNTKTRISKLLYIGTADNLHKRVTNHEIKRVLQSVLEYPYILSIKCKLFIPNKKYTRRCNGYYSLDELYKRERLDHEAKLINRLKPPINLYLK
jgi:hypothetical protein